jgi:hypothetical protein
VLKQKETLTLLQVTKDALLICSETVRQLAPPAYTKCLRFIERDDGVAISFERPQSDDGLVRHEGSAVLAVPWKSHEALSGMTLDVQEDGRFILSQS